jgi:microcystin-dependent protein
MRNISEQLSKDTSMRINNSIRTFHTRIIGAAVILIISGQFVALKAQADSPYLGQILCVAFDFAPRGWAKCEGQLLPINQNQALFALLGTTYGGNGTTNFALPDLRGRVAVHANNVVGLGQQSGEEAHTLTINEMPSHTHVMDASSSVGNSTSPIGNFQARDANTQAHYGPSVNTTMNAAGVGTTGGSQPHENRMPFLTLHYIIALQGVFPSRN